MRRTSYRIIYVRRRSGFPTRGWLMAGAIPLPVALGRGGIRADKREGDGGTPRGRFRLVRLWWRADRGPPPRTLLPLRPITRSDGWCENPADRRYNKPITVPEGAAADRLWRADRLYDLIIELDHNTRPRVAGRGSAVFIHVARQGFKPTAGCVALDAGALRRLLGRLSPKTRIDIR
ncbi:MAG TPA: L,D-transpeptidase family protein [Xanthobacteraceae bacterium]|nr:L,D-transpeptidase family protein [Xanthobacteraceae bacterium]